MMLADRRLLAREATALRGPRRDARRRCCSGRLRPGVDWAAHAYQRTFLLQHGFAIWNNFWYAGRYSFVTYSVLYYPLAALLGIRVLAVASIATAAARVQRASCCASGARSSRLSSRSFAVALGRHRRRGCVPVRARHLVRAARALGAPGRTPRPLRALRRPDARGEPARVRVPRGRRSAGGRARAPQPPRRPRPDRRGRGVRVAEVVLVRLFGDGGTLPVTGSCSSRRHCSSARSASS